MEPLLSSNEVGRVRALRHGTTWALGHGVEASDLGANGRWVRGRGRVGIGSEGWGRAVEVDNGRSGPNLGHGGLWVPAPAPKCRGFRRWRAGRWHERVVRSQAKFGSNEKRVQDPVQA
jgi:hypothetical protein